MQAVELRQNKASMLPLLSLLGVVAAGIFCYLIYSRSSGFNPIKIILLLAACLLVYVVWSTTKKLKKNEPLLTFVNEGLEINETKPVLLLWQDITGWYTTQSDATYYLIINTEKKRYSINISWMEVKSAEVEMLMKKFINAS